MRTSAPTAVFHGEAMQPRGESVAESGPKLTCPASPSKVVLEVENASPPDLMDLEETSCFLENEVTKM